jgi:hypothetical protein
VKAIARALDDAARQLNATSDTSRLDAELLMAEALHIDRDRLLLSPPDRDVPKRFWEMVSRRSEGEPVAYITGRRAFWNIELHVGPGVLVPRPDSEVLIASAIEHFEGSAGPKRILDLGTGPGTLLLAALDIWPDASGLGIDVSRQALSYASAPGAGDSRNRAARARRAQGAGRRRPRRPPPRGRVNVGLNDLAWQTPRCALHQCPGPGPLPYSKLSASRSNPRRNRPFEQRSKRRPEREGQELRRVSTRRSPGRLRAQGG